MSKNYFVDYRDYINLFQNNESVYNLNSLCRIGIFSDGVLIHEQKENSYGGGTMKLIPYTDFMELAELREIERYYTVKYYDEKGKKHELISDERELDSVEYEILLELKDSNLDWNDRVSSVDYITLYPDNESMGLEVVKEMNKYVKKVFKRKEKEKKENK